MSFFFRRSLQGGTLGYPLSRCKKQKSIFCHVITWRMGGLVRAQYKCTYIQIYINTNIHTYINTSIYTYMAFWQPGFLEFSKVLALRSHSRPTLLAAPV